MVAKKITSDGKIIEVPDQKLETLQKAVDGYVQIVPLKNGNNMIVNEEGLLMKLPVNVLASKIAGYPIVGNVVIIDGDMEE